MIVLKKITTALFIASIVLFSSSFTLGDDDKNTEKKNNSFVRDDKASKFKNSNSDKDDGSEVKEKIIKLETNTKRSEDRKKQHTTTKDAFTENINNENQTGNVSSEKVIAENIIEEITTKDRLGIKINNLFIKFNENDILNFDYNNIKFDNFGFLENEEELNVIKRALEKQQDPELKKIREEKNRLEQEIGSKVKILDIPVERSLKVYSLFFLDENNWEAKINHEVFNNKNRSKKTLFDTEIVKVNKNSIIFLIKKTDDKMVKRVKLIKKEKLPYSNNYYLVKNGKKTYVAFKLFNGQKIKLDTMIIVG